MILTFRAHAIDWQPLVTQMLTAAAQVVTVGWENLRPYAESEFIKLGQDLALIAQLVAEGKMDQQSAALHLDMQKNSMRAVFCTIEGFGLLVVEQIINAALSVVRNSINMLVGFTLI